MLVCTHAGSSLSAIPSGLFGREATIVSDASASAVDLTRSALPVSNVPSVPCPPSSASPALLGYFLKFFYAHTCLAISDGVVHTCVICLVQFVVLRL
jgi:hypothetical protein